MQWRKTSIHIIFANIERYPLNLALAFIVTQVISYLILIALPITVLVRSMSRKFIVVQLLRSLGKSNAVLNHSVLSIRSDGACKYFGQYSLHDSKGESKQTKFGVYEDPRLERVHSVFLQALCDTIPIYAFVFNTSVTRWKRRVVKPSKREGCLIGFAHDTLYYHL